MSVFHCTVKHTDCGGRCEHIDEVLKFLSVMNDETRLRIICVLTNTKGIPVGDIVEGVELPQNLVSHHLKSMHNLGIVTKEKIGLRVYYKLDQEKINYFTGELKILLNQKH